MDTALQFVRDSLDTKGNLNRLILNSVIDPQVESRIINQKLPLDEQRLLQYFFKVQRAFDRLLKNISEGLDNEAARILENKKLLAWKKKELEELRKLLRVIILNLQTYVTSTPDWQIRLTAILSKIDSYDFKSILDYTSQVEKFQKKSSEQIDSGKILIEEDWVKRWSEMEEKKPLKPESFALGMFLTQEEILLFNLATLLTQVSNLYEIFTYRFRDAFHFSMQNILKDEEIKIVSEKAKLSNKQLNLQLCEILKNYVSENSQQALQDFWEGKDVAEPIEFLGEKGHLFSVFRLLYNNRQITRKPILIGALVSKSFMLPNCEDGSVINSERVREAVSRKGMPTVVLPEVLDLAKRTNLSW